MGTAGYGKYPKMIFENFEFLAMQVEVKIEDCALSAHEAKREC